MGKAILEVNIHEFAAVLKENAKFTVVRGLPADANIDGWEYDGTMNVSIKISSPNYPETPEGSEIPKITVKLETQDGRKI